MAIDPICKMTVDEETAEYISEYKGRKYFFCALGCKKTFDENPDNFSDN
jgi:YHS domain-containing protein